MDRDEKVKEAQEVLNWVILYLKLSFNCKVIDYKHENYKVQFLTKENKSIMPVQIPEEWIKGSHPKENVIHERLELLISNLRNYS
jgi:endo-1,4-beta-mannosidase